MATVVNDLVTKFSFTGSPAPLKGYNQSLGGSIKLLGGVLLGLEASLAAFNVWADSILTGVDSLDQLSKQTQIAVGNIQELDYIAGQTQSTSAAMESTLRSLSQTIGSAAQKGSEDFARLGISVRDANGHVKTADVILDEVRQRFHELNLSMQEQESFASALGIDTSLIQLLNKSNAEIASLRDRARELGTLTAEQTEQADQYKKSLNSMWFSLNNVKQLVAIGVAPELGRMADGFAQLLADNRDWIVGGIQFTVTWVGNLLAAIHRLLPVIAAIGAGFLVAKIATLGFGTVMGVIFSPVVLITAGIVGLLAIIDDLIVAFHGGESVIASFFKDTFDVDIVDAMTTAFKWMGRALSPVVDMFKLLWDSWVRISAAIYQGGAAVARFFGLGGTNIPIGTGAAGQAAGSSTSNQVNQNVKIDIKTDDPLTAGKAVENGLQRQLDNANTQLGIGGR